MRDEMIGDFMSLRGDCSKLVPRQPAGVNGWRASCLFRPDRHIRLRTHCIGFARLTQGLEDCVKRGELSFLNKAGCAVGPKVLQDDVHALYLSEIPQHG